MPRTSYPASVRARARTPLPQPMSRVRRAESPSFQMVFKSAITPGAAERANSEKPA